MTRDFEPLPPSRSSGRDTCGRRAGAGVGCRAAHRKQHCDEHKALRDCFFRRLGAYLAEELQAQAAQLEATLRDAAAGSGPRRTLAAQTGRVRDRLAAMRDGIRAGGLA